MIVLQVRDDDLRQLAARLRGLENGAQLRKDLVRNLRTAVKPAADKAKQSIRSMPTHGRRHAGPSLRSAVARKVQIQVRTSGRQAGVRVRTGKTPNVRGFIDAPKRLNRQSWRHPAFGDTEQWVTQVGKPKWFDAPMQEGKPRYKRAVKDALDKTARAAGRRGR